MDFDGMFMGFSGMLMGCFNGIPYGIYKVVLQFVNAPLVLKKSNNSWVD